MSFTLSLENIASGETIDLSARSATDAETGAEAIGGATGFGLPSVDVHWSDGAGNGSTYRGSRVLPRDLDFTVDIVAEDEDDLDSQVASFARVLSGECRLWVDKPSGRRFVNVVRTGGGDYATGLDGNGQTELELPFTLRAGQPFWTSEDETPVSASGSGIGSSLTLANNGSAEASPVWEIHGPTLGFTLNLAGTDETFIYSEFVNDNETIIVDTSTGTVVDDQGRNRYSGVGPSPRFFKLPTGTHVVNVTMDRSSAAFAARYATGRQNFVINPAFNGDATGWDLTGGPAYDSTNHRAKSAVTYVANPASLTDGPVMPSTFGTDTPHGFYVIADRLSPAQTIATTITGLTPGVTYEAHITTGGDATPADPAGVPTTYQNHTEVETGIPAGMTGQFVETGIGRYKIPGTVQLDCGSTQLREDISDGVHVIQFVAGSPIATLTVFNHRWLVVDTGYYPVAGGTKSGLYYRGVIHGQVTADVAYLGEPGDYFDGNTVDTADVNYVWSGTANASTSQARPIPDLTKSKILTRFNQRDWMVV